VVTAWFGLETAATGWAGGAISRHPIAENTIRPRKLATLVLGDFILCPLTVYQHTHRGISLSNPDHTWQQNDGE
tara:strand:- start:369 stop:590 length:222 start_codon:yes stop_codon:yes gene_type:complete